MMKKALRVFGCAVLTLAILVSLLWGLKHRSERRKTDLSDGMSLTDTDKIVLEGSGVKVRFSDVILSKQNETRKLIVSTQTGTVSTELTDEMIDNVYWKILQKNQKVTYQGKGYFAVDLDNFSEKNIIQDEEAKTLTILIGHAYLETVDIDPNNIIIDEVQKGLLAWGSIKLTVSDYNTIEKELRSRLEKKFNTAQNAQQADDLALKMVKEVYEPLVKAIDEQYEVTVAFG